MMQSCLVTEKKGSCFVVQIWPVEGLDCLIGRNLSNNEGLSKYKNVQLLLKLVVEKISVN
jgi:hypothetical protein